MKQDSILNLNKIIYSLLIVIGIELSLFIFDFMVSRGIVKSKILKKSLATIHLKKVEKDTFVALSPPNRTQQYIEPKIEKVKTPSFIKISPKNYNDVVKIESPLVKPILYTKSVNLDNVSIAQKKRTFIDMMLPSILIAKHNLVEDKQHLLALLKKDNLTKSDRLWLTKKRHLFKAKSNDELYEKMEIHPTSIIIAQAIIESGWGTSKFFKKANNVFGVWSFNSNDKRMAASEKRGKKTVYLKKYDSVEESIADYLLTLSTKDAYKEFREKRLETQNPLELIKYLGNYSELRDEYIENLKNTIQKNKLLAYDSYQLDIPILNHNTP